MTGAFPSTPTTVYSIGADPDLLVDRIEPAWREERLIRAVAEHGDGGGAEHSGSVKKRPSASFRKLTSAKSAVVPITWFDVVRSPR